MLTLDEIRNLRNINPQIVREALVQAEKRLSDLSEVKKQAEQKSFVLFNGYLTLLIGEISAAFLVKGVHPSLFYFLVTLIPFFILSLVFIIFSLQGMPYGSLGSTPSMWLTKEILEGDDNALKAMLSYITFHHQSRIDESMKSNDHKLNLINFSAYTSIIGLLVALITSLLFSL